MKFSLLWNVIIVWFILSAVILSLSHDWGEIIFSVSFGVIYGGLVYLYRRNISCVLGSSKIKNFPVYLAVCILVSVFEEFYVYGLGNRIAVPNILEDIVIVPGEWLVWFATWYLFISKKFKFTAGEALFAAGFEGVMFELVGNGLFLSDPLGFIVSVPLTIVVYAAIFVLPMQFINFTGEIDSLWKYPVSVLVPYMLVIPVTYLLYAIVV